MTSSDRFTADELSAWRPNILSWQLIARYLDRQLIRDSGMPHAYYVILVALNAQRDRSLPITQLAEVLDYSQSRMSHAVTKLEASGWVERVADETDRRVSAIRLTEGGRAALASASVGHIQEVRRIFFAYLDGDDLVDLERIGQKLLDGLSSNQDLPSDLSTNN
jgi:DNA-binding MarR family transcriptional regulator